ncbi:MAG: HEAT repeat domain-containing protein [Treponema sp.]|nr:HEAT repeat domain-containing protein [Treponema sp.]
MKKNIGKLVFFCLLSFLFSQEIDVKPEENLNDSSEVNKVTEESTDSENNTETENIELEDESQKETSEIIISHKPGVSEVPEEKRPKTPSDERIKELDSTGEDNREKNTETLKFGMESDILDLLDELIKNEDVRFVNEVYDLFQETKSFVVREKILSFFTNIEDPCLEDFAIIVINDPYDEKLSTVNAVFRYIQTIKTKVAIPAILTLIENESEEYFNGALTTLGAIGGPEEAIYLTGFLDREDLTVAQKQQLVKVLGQIKAVETYDKLVEMAEDNEENAFIRMYSAEAIGSMGKEEAVEVLVNLYEDTDPKIREYVIRGLKNYKDNEVAEKIMLQATRDNHYKVRLEAIEAIKMNEIKSAVPYLIYRAKNDPENVVKKSAWPVIASLNTNEGNEFLVNQIKDKKIPDNTKSIVAKSLLEYNNAGSEEIIELAKETLKDDKRKPLRYALGKEFAKYKRDEYADLCVLYIANKDVATQGTGLDIYAKGRYASAESEIEKLILTAAKDTKKRNVNAIKAEKILGKENDIVKRAEKIKEESKKQEEEKKNKKNANAK